MFALFEDRLAPPGAPAAWLLTEPLWHWSGHADELAERLQAARQAGEWVAMALDYALGAEYEPKAGGAPDVDNDGLPTAQLWSFAQCRLLDTTAVEGWLSEQLKALPPAQQVAGVGGVQSAISQADYLAAVQKVQDYIRAGDCYQINLTFPLHFQTFGHPLALYAALRARQPSGHAAYIASDERSYLSLSPELFLHRVGTRLTTRPMKGTLPRLAGDEDARQPEHLQQCPKNRAENVMIVDLLRNDLARLGASPRAESAGMPAVQVSVQSLFAVEAYPTVWQMVSEVSADVVPESSDRLNLEHALPALFPCGSITGAPKVRAMQIINELEPCPRGLYTGSLGWQAPNGDYRLNVAIRTLVVDAQGQGTLGVGSGQVQDSVADNEWAECWLKARFLTAYDPGLELIETLRLEISPEGHCFQRLDAHLQRMQRSAVWLGYVFDEAVIRTQIHVQLADILTARQHGVWRVRLGLRKSGELGLTVAPLAPEPTGPRYVRLAKERVDASHPLQGHKTTWRPQYDQAVSVLAENPELFDLLYLNTAGELAEGSRSSVFILCNGEWLTPPLSSGALPGIWRAAVLAGEMAELPHAREAVLTKDDLLKAEAIMCGNSLRGGVGVRLNELSVFTR